MSKFYTPADCLRKANQHWEMAGLARKDNDPKDENNHTEKAKLWEQRTREGGHEEDKNVT